MKDPNVNTTYTGLLHKYQPSAEHHPCYSGLQVQGAATTPGGAAGNRTLVQTRNPYAFYMLSRLLVFDDGPESDTQAIAYPLKFSPFAKGGLRLTLN